MANQPALTYDLRTLSQAYFKIAKKWWGFSATCKVLTFSIGLISTIFIILPAYTPITVTFLEIASEICLWRSDAIKGNAEVLLRKLDARDSFGWQISSAELSDFFAKAPKQFENLAPAETKGEDYFASKAGLGAIKALENIQESAWWSKHLAERMTQYCLFISISILVTSLITLLISIQTISDNNVLTSLGRTVTSALMLIFTLGLFRMAINYYEFSQKAKEIEYNIDALLNNQNINDSDAIKIMHEYQLARASAPLIPYFVWRQMRDKLNVTWKDCR